MKNSPLTAADYILAAVAILVIVALGALGDGQWLQFR